MFVKILQKEVIFFCFFSSRRRHTRCSRDWSSDVCSSDLTGNGAVHVSSGCVRRNRGRGTRDEGRVIPRIVATPIAPLTLPDSGLAPRRVDADVIAAALPGPGRDQLAAGEVLVVTTGQQPGLLTGPLYTVYKAFSAMALARRLARERRTPVVPVFWVAGDDHDFAEANHTYFLDKNGELAQVVLRERLAEAALLPLARQPCGPALTAVLRQLEEGTSETEFKP